MHRTTTGTHESTTGTHEPTTGTHEPTTSAHRLRRVERERLEPAHGRRTGAFPVLRRPRPGQPGRAFRRSRRCPWRRDRGYPPSGHGHRPPLRPSRRARALLQSLGAVQDTGFADLLRWKLGEESRTTRARPPRMPVVANDGAYLKDQGGAPLGDLGGAFDVRGAGRRGGLPHRSPLRDAGPAPRRLTPAGHPPGGRAGGGLRRPLPQPLRPSGRLDGPPPAGDHPLVRPPGARRVVLPRAGRQVIGARLVAERPPWPVDPHLPARPALVEPARHGAQRHPLVLAGSSTPGTRRYYFAGDSGYFHGFAEIGRRFPGIDVAFLPIGAYEPRWFMRAQHVEPRGGLSGVSRPRRPDHGPHALGVLRPDGRARRPRPQGARAGPGARRERTGAGSGPWRWASAGGP